jgi:hypothetical protein
VRSDHDDTTRQRRKARSGGKGSSRAAQDAVSRSLGGTWDAGQASYEQPPRGRLARLFEAADRRHVPLRAILVTAGVVVATYVAGKLMYRLRDIVVLVLVAGFVAMLLTRPWLKCSG